jgi:heme-degrading monooxygenase HmoA
MVLEAVILMIKPGRNAEYEDAFRKASPIIASMKGYVRHELHRCLEVKEKYILLVWWQTLEDHTVGFRQSSQYHQWKQLLHHFYDPFPTVDHFDQVALA